MLADIERAVQSKMRAAYEKKRAEKRELETQEQLAMGQTLQLEEEDVSLHVALHTSHVTHHTPHTHIHTCAHTYAHAHLTGQHGR